MTIPVALVCLTAIVLYAMRLYEARGRRQIVQLTSDLSKLESRLEGTRGDLETVRVVVRKYGENIEAMDVGLKGHANALTTLQNNLMLRGQR